MARGARRLQSEPRTFEFVFEADGRSWAKEVQVMNGAWAKRIAADELLDVAAALELDTAVVWIRDPAGAVSGVLGLRNDELSWDPAE